MQSQRSLRRVRVQRSIEVDDNPVGDWQPVNFIDPALKMPAEAGASTQ